MASSNLRGVTRVLEKIDNSIKNGDYYEAHQLYKMLYFRWVTRKFAQCICRWKFSPTFRITSFQVLGDEEIRRITGFAVQGFVSPAGMRSGARFARNFTIARWIVCFLQHISGADLGILLVDVLVQSENKKYAEWTPKLCKIFAKINSTVPERDTFLLGTIRWSSSDGKHGYPLLHQVIQISWNYYLS